LELLLTWDKRINFEILIYFCYRVDKKPALLRILECKAKTTHTNVIKVQNQSFYEETLKSALSF
jgi:hypothetical protein